MIRTVSLVVVVGAVVLSLVVAERRIAEEDLIRQELQPRSDLYR